MDKKSFQAGIAVGKAMKGWSTAASKGTSSNAGTVPLENFARQYTAVAALNGLGTMWFTDQGAIVRSAALLSARQTALVTYDGGET